MNPDGLSIHVLLRNKSSNCSFLPFKYRSCILLAIMLSANLSPKWSLQKRRHQPNRTGLLTDRRVQRINRPAQRRAEPPQKPQRPNFLKWTLTNLACRSSVSAPASLIRLWVRIKNTQKKKKHYSIQQMFSCSWWHVSFCFTGYIKIQSTFFVCLFLQQGNNMWQV